MKKMKFLSAVLVLFLVTAAFAADAPRILIALPKNASPELRQEAEKLREAPVIRALLETGTASRLETVDADSLLDKDSYNRAAFNTLVVVGKVGSSALADRVAGHQAVLDPEKREFYRLGHGRWHGDLGWIESDWNPFLFSNRYATNSFMTVLFRITGTTDAATLAALCAFRRGMLNGLVPAGTPEKVEPSLLDYLPDGGVTPVLPEKLGALRFAGVTLPDRIEFLAWGDRANAVPCALWRFKYFAPGALNGVAARNWNLAFHRQAVGNTVLLAEFATAAEAEKSWRALSRARTALWRKFGEVQVVEFPSATDEAFEAAPEKVRYAWAGTRILGMTLPDAEAREMIHWFVRPR